MNEAEHQRPETTDRKKILLEALAIKYARALRMHEDPGKLWEKDAQGKDWRNVTEHCLMEAARGEVFGEKLKLPSDIAADLATAAALHDFYKKIDIQYTREDMGAGGSGRDGNLRSEKESAEQLRVAGYAERIIRLVGSVGGDPETLIPIKEMLDRDNISDDDIAYITMHYIDDYTAGSDWVVPAENGMNEIDIRAARNASNPDYEKMNNDVAAYKGRPFFEGMTRFEAQAAIGHLIEKKLADLIAERSGEKIKPLQLAEAVDKTIRQDR